MTSKYRRVVTGHTPEGKSTVLFDSSLQLVGKEGGSGAARQEDRTGTASAVLWSTRGFPATNNDSADSGLVKVGTALSDGTVLRIVKYLPGVTPRHHRTDSIDYAVVLSGSIELELDTETLKLETGDVLVQRGTIHNWINNGTEPCVMFYALLGANPVALSNGVTLDAQG